MSATLAVIIVVLLGVVLWRPDILHSRQEPPTS
jgi:hypothetical protein